MSTQPLDVVVIGAGHNALVSACLPGRAGWSVRVVERDTDVGGAVSTVERFPGHRVDRGSSAHLMIRHTGIVEELGLAAHGLRYIDCDPWAFAPARTGNDRSRHRLLARPRSNLRVHRGVVRSRDADAYRRFVGVWGPRSARVMRAFGHAPTGGALLKSFWGLDATDGGASSRASS